MIKKRLVFATSMMAFLAMAGHAYAGTTISDARYWPSEVRSSEVSSIDQTAAHRAENAFDSVETLRAPVPARQSYQGGPKGSG
jgi:hypothetical protein